MTASGLGFNLCGYRVIEELNRDSKTVVYRAQPIATKLGAKSHSVVIKLLVAAYPTDRELLNFRHQYTILQERGTTNKLDLPGVVSVYSLEASDRGYALVMEDFGGVSLVRYRQHDRLPLVDVLKIAIQLADTLHALGRSRIVHKDLKPANILINPTTQQVKLIDFGIASILPREYLELQSPSWLEGTLAYLAPEQTGRMNRGIDYRTDFYGLGVTLYELLTGKLPFEVADPLDLIHCHLEREAVRIDVVNPAVPPVVAQIVAKLMAKKAEDRYQSALGLKDDLERCLHQRQTTGAIEAFELAQRDASDRFTIPERLYGRELAVKILLDTFDRVAAGGSELVLVAGCSGIGKTALINEIHKPITRQHGYFIKGKFDQFNRNMPMSGFVQALRDLITQLTSEGDARLAVWNSKILAAVGANGQVLIDAIPELEQITGSQPPAIELPPAAAQQRFSGLFQKLIEVFTTPTHPLTIFLDDLQWADAASLESIELLMAGKGYLLILGAYRDNEVSPNHLLTLTLDRLRQARRIVRKISLAPLTFDDLDRLVADTLRCPRSKTQPLTELIALKTEGNPFFATQFLKALHAAGEIRFNAEGGWECDIASIQALALSDDVVEFMAAQLEQLPLATQQVLKLAACIGNSFDLETLAIVSERSRSSVETLLWQALEAGLILPSGQIHKFDRDLQDLEDLQDYVAGGSHAPHTSSSPPVAPSPSRPISQSPHLPVAQSPSLPVSQSPHLPVSYRFLHDRVQQAAYSLIPAGEKQQTHLQIGRLLLANTPARQQEEKLFEIVNHFNLAIVSMTAAECTLVARLNLRAAVKARAANAYAAAYEYAGIGADSLGSGGWDTEYSLVLALHETRSEAAFLKGDFAAVPRLAKAALEWAKTPLDRVKTYETIIQCHIIQKQYQEAILRGLEILRQLGIKLAPKPNKLMLGRALVNTKVALWGKSHVSLLNLPDTIDPAKIAPLRILNLLMMPAFLCSQELMVLAITAGIQFTLRYGNTPWSSIFYSTYGIVLASLGDYNQSYQMGKLAVELDARYQNQVVTAQVNGSVAWFCQPWREHLRQSIPPLEACIKGSMESGNLTTLGLSSCVAIIADFYLGNPLDGIAIKIATLESLLTQSPDYSQQLLGLFRHTVGNLRSISNQPTLIHRTSSEEIAALDRLKAYGEASALSTIYALKTSLAYIFADIPTALSYADAQLPYEFADSNCYSVTQLWMFDALTRLAAYPQRDRATQTKLLARVKSTQRKLLKCARLMPANFQHKYDLVAAEKCRVLGDFTQAMALYDRAIAGAKANEFCQEEAIANELAAKFYLVWGKAKIAAVYMQAAYYGYVLWGATAKTADLERCYPQLLAPILAAQQVELNALATLTQISNCAAIQSDFQGATSFDLVTTIQAAQTLASTIELTELIRQLSEILLKNSGAQTCILVLPDDDADRWLIRSQSVADADANSTTTQLSQPLTDGFDYPANLIYSIKNTQQAVVFDARQPFEIPDLYLLEHQPPSVFCLPIVKQSRVLGVVYLEHRHTPAIFTQQHQTVISFLCHQAAIALDNANLYRQAQAAAASVRLQQSYLEALLDNIPHMAWLKDAESQFIAVNRACAAISGFTPVELVGKNDLDLWPVELGQQYRDNDIEVMASGERQVVEERTWTLEGEPRWLETIKTPIRNSDGQIAGTAGIALDITDRKVMEVALRQSEERYSQLVSNVPGALYQFELKADGTYNFKYISARCVELFEISPQTAVADLAAILNQILPADRASFDRSIKKATKLGKSWAWEGRISTPSGQIKWIRGESRHQPLSDGSIVWDGIMTDVTTRKHTEIALRQSEVRYQKLADNIPGVIYQVRFAPDRSMTYLYMSSGCWELFQLTPGEIVADSACLLQMLHPEDAVELERVTAISAQNLTPKLWEGRVALSTGEIKWIKCASRPELQLDGSIVWDGVMLDVTDRKQAELTLLATNQELQQATRLKDEFLATMSHELRTPLNAILGMSESLQAAVFGTLDPRQMTAIATIEQSGEHLLSLINDILDVSKISAAQLHLNLDRVSLSQLCKSSLSLVKPQARAKQIQIETHLAVAPDWISIDERRMRQVLINLLNNAVKFTPSGGRVKLTVSIEAGDRLCFAISDTGIGIASTDRAKLFQPFVQIDSSLNRKYQGTGLGLVLVKQIVELHGGTVTIESEVGTGSCFRVLLPQTCWQSEPTQIALTSPTERIVTVPTILLAVSNEVIIDTFSNYLTAKGYRVILAQTGAAAMSLLEGTDRTRTRPDLMSIDLQLPQSNHLELLAAACRSNIPTIALTDRVSTDERAQCLQLGAAAYLAKPVKLIELYQTIQDCLNLN
jgi:PAS domain S-box-containing protein